MSPENITGLVCLSFALLFLCVNSISCISGWFGPGCKYKCRCVNDQCDFSGSCTAPFTCQGGWFGPACQYADLAYLQASPPEVTDGNDSTCKPTRSITIQLEDTHFFTWMRVIISDQAPAALDKLTVTFSPSSTPFKCDDLKTHVVDKQTVDLHCNLTVDIDELTLEAKPMSVLCSVYVSGGRNVALNEDAYQESTYSEIYADVYRFFMADLAVDGDTNQELHNIPPSCAVTNFTPTWTLSFSMPRRVHRYVIYNRIDGSPWRMRGFRLQSFDSSKSSVFEYKDPNTVVFYPIYIIIHRPTSIEGIEITVVNDEHILQLCEVEVYGDSDCDHDHYGLDCELSCNCLYGEACFASTGGCPSGCPTGFYGDGCMISCSFGKFGKYCNTSCSKNCVSPANTTYCNVSTGACLLGCNSGFEGVFCQDECPAGTFGANCNSSCSPNCMPTGEEDVSACDPVTGNCSNGCNDGFSGSSCLEECTAGHFGANCSSLCSRNCIPTGPENVSLCYPVTGSCRMGCKDGFSGSSCLEESMAATTGILISLTVVGLCLLIVALGVIGFCFCKKRSVSPSEEDNTSSFSSELLD